MENQIISEHVIASGDWLNISEIMYRNPDGKSCRWEAAGRNSIRGAVAVIPVMKPSNRVVLVSQFRPPAKAQVIEFPAGLLDKEGEELEATALREVKEETGYLAKILEILPPTLSSPGMTGESVHIAVAEIDETADENMTPCASPDENEFIKVQTVPLKDLNEFLANKINEGFVIDSKVACFALGMSLKT